MTTNDYNSSMELLKMQNINLDSEVTVAVESGENNATLLYEIYNPYLRHQSKFIVQFRGSWSQQNGLNLTSTESKVQRRSNLNGIVIHAGIVATGVERNQTLGEYLESELSASLEC